MGRGSAKEDASADGRPYRRQVSSDEQHQLIAKLLSDLEDDESGVSEEFGSTYAVVTESERGPIHLLFRLEDGDSESPEIIACYVGGQPVVDVDAEIVEQIVRVLLEQEPWLIGDV
jgi:hypothetical protein